ncbi:MAG: glycosyltransferase family 4 protein [Bdellovibrionales bacterium]|nr:glycosyltransferase family 4 protein [Bdellovibrionales bacterium]
MLVGLDTSGLDEHFREHAHRGTGRYISKLWSHLEKLDQSVTQVESVRPMLSSSRWSAEALVQSYLPFGKATVSRQLLFPLRLMSKSYRRFDLLHFPAHIDAPSWSVRPIAVTVLDLIPVVLSDLYAPEKYTWRFTLGRWLELQAIRNAQLIFAISQHTADDVQRVLGISQERIVVTPLGIDENFSVDPNIRGEQKESVLDRFGVPKGHPTVVYVGGIDQRKNTEGLLGAFESLCHLWQAQVNSPQPHLLLVGKIQSDGLYPRLRERIKNSPFSSLVHETGYVADGELPLLLQSCSVFLFPSLYEGFGLPPLEAMACGIPVVSSNRSCLPEVLGDAALFFDPEVPDRAAEHIRDLLLHTELYQSHRSQGFKQAKKFSWSKTAELTFQGYERFLHNPQWAYPGEVSKRA